MKRIRKLWFLLAASLPLNMIYLIFTALCVVFIDNQLFFKAAALLGVISLCLVNFTYNYRDLERYAMTDKINEQVRKKR